MRNISIDALVVEIEPCPPEKHEVYHEFMGKNYFTDQRVYFSDYRIVEGVRRRGDNEQVYEVLE